MNNAATTVTVHHNTYLHILGALADAFMASELEAQGYWAAGQLAYLCGQDSIRAKAPR